MFIDTEGMPGLTIPTVENGSSRKINSNSLKPHAPAAPRLRVCHLGKFYPPAPGGIESHLKTLAQAQVQLGAEVQVVCINHQDGAGNDVTWRALTPTLPVEECDGPVRVVRVGRSASFSRFDFCPGLPGLFRRLVRSGVDLLHLHVPNPTMLLALAMLRPPLPWVITYHSDVVRQRFLGRVLRPFENVVFKRAGAVLATSAAYRTGSEYLQRQGDKVNVLPFGIDLHQYRQPSAAVTQAANRFRQAHGQPLWLAVGRLVYYKGLDIALQALVQVPGKLMIVGEGPLHRELQDRADRLGVAERVIWAGRLDDTELAGAYHAASALWFPSNAKSEAFGLVQIEAMACGCPVINTDIPGSGVAWVSRHEESGLTVPINDADSFAAAAQRLLDEPGLRDRLSRQARTRANDEFDAELMARRTLELYRRVLTRVQAMQ